MFMKSGNLLLFCGLLCSSMNVGAQNKQNLLQGAKVELESSTTLSDGDFSPLWLSGNRYGLVSVEPNSNYERVSLVRPYTADSQRQWKLGYGVDLALCFNHTSSVAVQQAYFDVVYKKMTLTVGAKQHPIDLRNNQLTSGGMGMGINARPIPQVRLTSDYFSVPGTRQWWKMRFRGSYGMTTDGGWQKDFVSTGKKYTSNVLYHEKALYWKFGREDKFPLTFEIGIQMAAQFGGTSYNVTGRNHREPTKLKHDQGFGAFWDAFVAGGGDATDGTEKNTAGNHLGSYNMALTYNADKWKARAYFERYFEDQSMLTVQYGIYDHLLGAEVELPENPFVSNIVVEHISTKDQSGAVYHDQSATIPDKMNGRDNYYNHNIYSGWQHWGMSLGHPLITSPIYNGKGEITFRNNRIKAWHIGLSGHPTDWLTWRAMLTFTENWGTYMQPFDDVLRQNSFFAEIGYSPKRFKGWDAKVGFAVDNGDVLGNSFGGQFTLRKSFSL